MKRALPLWLAAAMPAALAGHGLAYALSGRSAADGHHAWMAAAIEGSLALLAALSCALVGSALLRTGVLIHTSLERSWPALWPRLALLQLALFAAMERAEGTHAGIFGCLIQLLTALGTAYILDLFGRLLARCRQTGDAASRYLERALRTVTSFISRLPAAAAHALAVRAGTSRFQRPPPASPPIYI